MGNKFSEAYTFLISAKLDDMHLWKKYSSFEF